MRKSLWTIPVVLLFTALGSTAAHADTIVTSGGKVTGINGITVAGTTYNVTWGTAIDTTFAASLTNATAINNAIAADLSAYGASAVVDSASSNVITVGVDGGVFTPYAAASGVTWPTGVVYTSQFMYDVATYPNNAWDEFAVVATPEPGALTLTLTGVGLLGLMVVMRKRKARGLAQAT